MAKTIRSKGQVALCQALVDARKRAGLGQDDLANRLKCHQSLVARAIGFDPFDVLAIVEAATEPDHRI
ncbi:XRE family transcriptional regulator [Rhodobacteraceae bacterium G21628-S1]|nr:XRE family transcriptional regulator [Rhodobacteraceae bacterium G21628-S1]